MLSTALSVGADARILDTLARLPFAERNELAAFTCLPASTTLTGLMRLQSQGLVDFVYHTRSSTSRVRRWHLTPYGIVRLAEFMATTVSRLMREWPLSDEWLTSLIQRLDVVAVFYRVAQDIVSTCGGLSDWCWICDGTFDVLLKLSDGRELALMRFGTTVSWKDMRRRAGLLYGMQRSGRCPPALLLVPGDLEAQRLRADLRGRAIDAFAASEDELALAGPGSPIWRALRDPRALTLEQVLEHSVGSCDMHTQEAEGWGRDSKSSPAPAVSSQGLDRVSTELAMPEKRLLLGLYDWPLMREQHLMALLGMSKSMIKKTASSLKGWGLICRLRIGETPALRHLNGTRLCLGSDGLRYLARLDGTREGPLLARWGIASDEAGDARLSVRGYRLDGSRIRVLAQELSHTDGVSEFLAMLASACRDSSDWRLLQALPPHRWERWFTYNGTWRCIRPDATLELGHRGVRQPCLLEFEQSAVRPAAMREKLFKYEPYFGSLDSRRDFDARRPSVVFVFVDDVTAIRFRNVVSREARRPIPVLVSSLETLLEEGPFGHVWHSPSRPGKVSLAAAVRV